MRESNPSLGIHGARQGGARQATRPLTGGQGSLTPSDPLVTTAGVTSYERSLYDAWY